MNMFKNKEYKDIVPSSLNANQLLVFITHYLLLEE